MTKNLPAYSYDSNLLLEIGDSDDQVLHGACSLCWHIVQKKV